MAKYYHVFPTSIRDQLIMPLLDHLPYSMRKLKMAARSLSQPAPQRWMNWFGIFNGQLKEDLLSASTKASIDTDASRAFRRLLEKNPQRRPLVDALPGYENLATRQLAHERRQDDHGCLT